MWEKRGSKPLTKTAAPEGSRCRPPATGAFSPACRWRAPKWEIAGGLGARIDVEYRVRAGDAITRKYRLRASARPHVTVFHKTYRFPEYTQMPPKEVSEDSGDLVAIEGTEVELRLETDQAVNKAELRLET